MKAKEYAERYSKLVVEEIGTETALGHIPNIVAIMEKMSDELMEEAKQWFLKAKPLFEKAHTLKPDDTSTIRSLRDIYARTGEDEKLMEMSDKLKALGQ